MSKTAQKFACPLVVLGLLALLGSWNSLMAAENPVNPHWTGIHCAECHVGSAGPVLQFDGDVIRVCNRCHGQDQVLAEAHPVGFAPSADMRTRIPPSWPLTGGRLTCLTCHDALPQMQANALQKFINPVFLRGNPQRPHSDFCFACHDEQQFQKLNPHEQISQDGKIITQRCRVCHRSVPDRTAVHSIEAAALKSGVGICISCHADQQNRHPAQADHLLAAPEDLQKSLAKRAAAGSAGLPLLDGNIICGTCHDPHQPGVLQAGRSREGPARFLRLDGGRELCVACHADKTIRVKGSKAAAAGSSLLPDASPSQHKPQREKKCKACHAISPGQPAKPQPLLLCLREGCHTTEMINQAHVHEKSVLGNCFFCHQPHTSDYAKLLRIDAEKTCAVCHPLLRDKAGKLATVDHAVFESYAARAGLPPAQGCSACHSPEHYKAASSANMALCADCHQYVRKAASANPHKDFADKTCTSCHDPHASPHDFQLKQPPETYGHAQKR